MQIARPTPGSLEIRSVPWALWLVGAAFAAGGALLLLLGQLGWVSDLRCRHDSEGEVRCTLTRSLYGLLPSATELRGVTGARVDVSSGSRSNSYRTVLVTAQGDVPLQPYSSSGGGDTALVERLGAFVADPSQPELAVSSHDPMGLAMAVLMIVGGLAMLALTPVTTWSFEGGELRVRRARLAGAQSEAVRLEDLRYADVQHGSKRATTRVVLVGAAGKDIALTSYYSSGGGARKREAVDAVNALLAQRGALDPGALNRAREGRAIVEQGAREFLSVLSGGVQTETLRRADGREVSVPVFLREALRADPENPKALATLSALLPSADDRRRFLGAGAEAAVDAGPRWPALAGEAAQEPAGRWAAVAAAAPAAAAQAPDGLAARLVGLLTFRAAVYRRIAEDPRALGPAAAIVALTAAATGFAGGLTSGGSMTVNGRAIGAGLELALIQLVAVTVSALVGWVVGSALCALAARALGGRTDTGEMLRVCGHVNLFGLLELLPGGVLLVWGLSTVGTVLGAREAAEFSTRRAAVAAALGWGVALALAGLLRVGLTIGGIALVGMA